jgi:N-acetylneuraminic acid mutarotase
MIYRVTILFLLGLVPFSFAKETKWQIPDMPVPVSSFGAVECEGYLYVYGGHAGKTHKYDTKTVIGSFWRIRLPAEGKGEEHAKWEELPNGPILQGMNLATNEGKIYRVGGMQPRNQPNEPTDTHSVADVAVYDPKSKKWSDLPSLPSGRSSHDVIIVRNKLYVIGGWELKGKGQKPQWAEDTLELDLKVKDARWKRIKQPFRRRALTVSAIGEKIYVIGGLDSEGHSVQRVDIFDVSTQQWSQGPEYLGEEVGFSPAAATIRGTLILSTSDGNLQWLNLKKNTWEKLGESATKRMVHRLVPFGKNLLLVGGANKTGPIAGIETIPFQEK